MKFSRMFIVLVSLHGALLAQQGNESQDFFDRMKAKGLEMKAQATVQADMVKETLSKKIDEAKALTKESILYAKSFFSTTLEDQHRKSHDTLPGNSTQDSLENLDAAKKNNEYTANNIANIQTIMKTKSLVCMQYLHDNMLATGVIITTATCAAVATVYYIYADKKTVEGKNK